MGVLVGVSRIEVLSEMQDICLAEKLHRLASRDLSK
jgi:hypothetical protein